MSEHITHTEHVKRLERSSSDRILTGVAGGLGRYFDLNPAFFRIGFVVLTLLGGTGILTYLAALLVMPEEGAQQSIAARVLAERRQRPWPLVGLGLAVTALAVLLSRATIWPAAGAGWLVVLISGLVILWAFDASRGDRRSRRILAAVTTLLALVAAAAVAVVVVAFTWFDVSLGDGVGDRVESPANVAALDSSYHLGVGNLRVDLSSLALTRRTQVRAKVGVGALRIVVPRDVSVAVDARAKVGDVHVLRRHDDGRNAAVRSGADGLLVIDARVGAGRIDVVRASP